MGQYKNVRISDISIVASILRTQAGNGKVKTSILSSHGLLLTQVKYNFFPEPFKVLGFGVARGSYEVERQCWEKATEFTVQINYGYIKIIF